LVRDARAESATTAKDCTELPPAVDALEKAVRDFRLLFAYEGSRLPVQKALALKNFDDSYGAMRQALDALDAVLETQAPRDPALENCWQRGQALAEQLRRWHAAEDDNLVRWVEVFTQTVQLHATPLSVAEGFGKQLEAQPRAWIFTSATLAV